jgi:hypothetical protein
MRTATHAATHIAITRIQRICLTAAAAGLMSGSVLVCSSATATTDLASGGSTSSPTSALDIAVYIAQRKMDWAQDRVDRAWLYR